MARMWQQLVKLFVRTSSERFGIDFGTETLRVVDIRGNEGGTASLRFDETITINLAGTVAAERMQLGNHLREQCGGVKSCAMVVEHPTLRIRRMNIAPMPENDLLEAIRWNFREHVDCPIEKYSVGYTRLWGYDEGGRLALMAFGVAEEAIHEHVQLVKDMGLELEFLEPVATALLSVFHTNELLEAGKFVVCLHLGAAQAYFVVMTKGLLLFSRPLPGVSLEALVKLVARNINVEPKQADRLLREWAIIRSHIHREVHDSMSAGEREARWKVIDTTIAHFMSQLVIEMQRSIDAFCIMYDADEVHALYLCGPGVLLPNVVGHIQHSLGIQATLFNPFEKLQVMSEAFQGSDVDRAAYSVAIGLALT